MTIRISITLETSSFEEAAAFLTQSGRVSAATKAAQDAPEAYAPSMPPPAPSVAVEPAGEVSSPLPKPKTTKAKRAAVQQDLPIEPAAKPTIHDVRAALQKLLAAKGVEACSTVLSAANVRRIGELADGDYAKFIAACGAAAE